MGKKSIAAKKRQRKRQQQKKLMLLLINQPSRRDPAISTCIKAAHSENFNHSVGALEDQPAINDWSSALEDQVTVSDRSIEAQPAVGDRPNHDRDSERRRAAANRLPPGYSKYTTGAGVVYYGGIREEDREKLRFVQSLPLKEQVLELHRLLFDRTEAATYFRDKCVKQDEEIEELQLEFDARLKEVRRFWRDKIYHEHCRAGKLLKLSMQK